MLVKITDDHGLDLHLMQCQRLHWVANNEVACYTDAKDQLPAVSLLLAEGHRVFIMNNDGKTIDSKRITR